MFYLATRSLVLFNPPAQKKQCLKEEVYYVGDYVPKPFNPPPQLKKKMYDGRSIFVGYGLQHSAGDILYT